MRADLQDPTVQKAIAEIEALDARRRKLCAFVNQAYELNDLPVPYPDASPSAVDSGLSIGIGQGPGLSGRARFSPDEFLGKPFAGAARRVLEARKAVGLGPASIDEIRDALASGGFKFETSTLESQKSGIRIALGKNSQNFVKIPNSDLFGLVEWYGAQVRKTGKRGNGDETPAAVTEDARQEEAAGGPAAANDPFK